MRFQLSDGSVGLMKAFGLGGFRRHWRSLEDAATFDATVDETQGPFSSKKTSRWC